MIENGKRSLWDELVDGQLEKCRPVAFLRRHALDAAPHAVIPGGPIAVTPSEESLRSMDDDDDTAGVQHTLGPATAEEIGLSAAAGPKDDDGVLPPSLCLSEEQLVAEYSSNGAPLGVNKATKVGPSTLIDLVTPATTSGPRETPFWGRQFRDPRRRFRGACRRFRDACRRLRDTSGGGHGGRSGAVPRRTHPTGRHGRDRHVDNRGA